MSSCLAPVQVAEIVTSLKHRWPFPIPPDGVRVAPQDPVQYVTTAADTVTDLVEAGLNPDDHVFDLGCGSGRIAGALTHYLSPRGRYTGVDVMESRVDWCTANIGSRYPNFFFQFADVKNRYYRPRGQDARGVSLPIQPDSVDFVMMNSVFTHLDREDTVHYLREVAKALKKGGRFWCTWFIANSESRDLVAEGQGAFPFIFEGNGPDFYTTKERSLLSVAYEESFILDEVKRAGLTPVRDIHYGDWCGRPRRNSTHCVNQDVLLLTRE